jgi:hypothetical protein
MRKRPVEYWNKGRDVACYKSKNTPVMSKPRMHILSLMLWYIINVNT